MTATPAEVPDALFERLRTELDEARLVELTSAIAWENYRARFNRGFAIGSDGFHGGQFCPLPVGAPVTPATGGENPEGGAASGAGGGSAPATG